MESQRLKARLKLLRRVELPGLLVIFAGLAAAQILPPGQLPPKPPQPGELGPGPANRQGTADPAAGSDVPTIGSVKVRYVLVPTTVVDKDNGNYINGLTARDFQLLYSVQVLRPRGVPVQLALLLDRVWPSA